MFAVTYFVVFIERGQRRIVVDGDCAAGIVDVAVAAKPADKHHAGGRNDRCVVGKHLRLRARSPGAPPLDVVAWGAMQGPLGPALLGARGRRFHLAGKLELSTYGGRQRVRLRLDDAAEPA